MEQNHLKLIGKTSRAYFTPRGEKPATDVWVRRFLAHVCDAVITIILGLLLYAACLAIAGPLGYDRAMQTYESYQQKKIDFLIEQGIMVEGEKDSETLTDSQMFDDFLKAYVSYDTLVEEDKSTPHYRDTIFEFFANRIEDLDFSSIANPSERPEKLGSKEYFNLLDEYINKPVGSQIFVFDEEKQLPVLNSESSSSARSFKDQLLLYIGVDPQTGETVQAQSSTSSANLYKNVATGYLNLRKYAATIALSDRESLANELLLAQSSNHLAVTQTACVIVGWLLGFIIYRAICFPIFRYGRTIGKRVLGFYVVDRQRRKAKTLQLIARSAFEALEQFWTIIFGMVISFSAQALTAPIFIVNNRPVSCLWFMVASLAIYFISAFVALLRRDNMDSLHDLISRTVVIALNDSELIERHLSLKTDDPSIPGSSSVDMNMKGENDE